MKIGSLQRALSFNRHQMGSSVSRMISLLPVLKGPGYKAHTRTILKIIGLQVFNVLNKKSHMAPSYSSPSKRILVCSAALVSNHYGTSCHSLGRYYITVLLLIRFWCWLNVLIRPVVNNIKSLSQGHTCILITWVDRLSNSDAALLCNWRADLSVCSVSSGQLWPRNVHVEGGSGWKRRYQANYVFRTVINGSRNIALVKSGITGHRYHTVLKSD